MIPATRPRGHVVDLSSLDLAALDRIERVMRELSRMFQGRADQIAREIKQRKRMAR